MWKCASRTIKATLQKGVFRCNTVLSTKVPHDNCYKCLLRVTPSLIEHINRYYGFYKSSCRKFSRENKDRDGPKEKKNSFLDGFDSNLFDALRWSGVFVLGYYFLQPFAHKRLTPNYNCYGSVACPIYSGYQKTLKYLFGSASLQPFNYILPEAKVVKGRNYINNHHNDTASQHLKSDEESYSSLEKAHHKVIGTLNNWVGMQCMESGKHKQALEYFKKSANEENPAGIFNLAICHERGLGTSQNFKRAAELYKKAADLGHATAMYNLGVFYAQGLGGVVPNVDHARKLFITAASLGQRDAKKALTVEKETCEVLPENVVIPAEDLAVKNEVRVSSFISDIITQQAQVRSVSDCKVYDDSEKNNSYESDNCVEGEKVIYSIVEGDSGVLDLSPRESDILVAFM